jgi:uncharacterized protein DUF4270
MFIEPKFTTARLLYISNQSSVNSRILVFSIGSVFLSLLFFFSSCKKINEATTLGGDLIPAVDNVHTFEVSLSAVTKNILFNDSTRVLYTDLVALGDLNDPDFGNTHANIDFNIVPSSVGSYPFLNKDSVEIDSVVLSLSYVAAFGDTLNNGMQTVRVYEIAQNAPFSDTALYKYTDPNSDFATAGPELGSASYTVRNLKDTLTLTRPGDTSKVINVLRIPLDNSLGVRLAKYDTANGYKNDSLFLKLFAGFALKADVGANALSYFNLSDINNTKLTVYFRATLNGKKDTTSFDYYHAINGQSNYINRDPGGNYLTYLNNGAGDKIYLQSAPGSYASIKIPQLDTFSNKVIHLAEIVATRVPSAGGDLFSTPVQLMLDHINKSGDTIFMMHQDLIVSASGSIGFPAFGGRLHADDTYRFNISRYVQGIVTRHEANDTLRIYAPLRTNVYNSALRTKITIPVIDAIAKGRVVLGGGTYTDSTSRLRLRIIYSNL